MPGADDRVSDWPDERGAKSTDPARALAMVLRLPLSAWLTASWAHGDRSHDANGQGGGAGNGSSSPESWQRTDPMPLALARSPTPEASNAGRTQ